MIVWMAGELFSHVFTVTRLNISQARAAFTENYKHSVIFVVGCSRNDQSESPVRFGTFAIEVCWIYSDSYLFNDSNHMISVSKTISKYICSCVFMSVSLRILLQNLRPRVFHPLQMAVGGLYIYIVCVCVCVWWRERGAPTVSAFTWRIDSTAIRASFIRPSVQRDSCVCVCVYRLSLISGWHANNSTSYLCFQV